MQTIRKIDYYNFIMVHNASQCNDIKKMIEHCSKVNENKIGKKAISINHQFPFSYEKA